MKTTTEKKAPRADLIRLKGEAFSGRFMTRINFYAKRPTDNEWEYLGFFVLPNGWIAGLNKRVRLSEHAIWTNGSSISVSSRTERT